MVVKKTNPKKNSKKVAATKSRPKASGQTVKIVSVREAKKKESAFMFDDKNRSALYKLAMKIDYQLGRYAFIVGVIAALIFTFTFRAVPPVEFGIFLIALGLVIGLVNVTHKERNAFLIAVIALVAMNSANLHAISIWNIGPMIHLIIINLMILFAPAALIVALESIYSLARNR